MQTSSFYKTLFFIFFYFLIPELYTQDISAFRFRKFQVDDGLSENAVYCILQDYKGFLWVGTKDGLNKYDGINSRVFRHEKDNPISLGNNFIRSIAEGKNNMLYVGTDDGLYVMDPIRETFRRLKIEKTDKSQILNAINTLLLDSKGRLWAGTMESGIFMITSEFEDPIAVPVPDVKARKDAVWTLYEDKSGMIWAGTRSGLLRYNKNKNTFEEVAGVYSQNDYNNEVLAILEDKKGNLWLGTWAEGIRFYDKQTEKYTSYYGRLNNNQYITHIRVLFQYSDDTLLVGSDDGLYLFNIRDKFCKRIDVQNQNQSLSDQNVYSIIKDREDGIWIGTYFGGLNYLNPSILSMECYYPGNTHRELAGKAISEFIEDEKGNLWIATEDGGIHYFEVKSKKFSRPIVTSYHNIHALLLNGDELWIGTFSRGIDIFNLRTKTTVNLRHNPHDRNSLKDDCVFSLYKTKFGNIYVGTPAGLSKYNPEDRNFIHVDEIPGFVYDVREDSSGNLWIASYGSGVIKLDTETKKIVNYSSILPNTDPVVNAKMTGIHIDNQKQLWFSSEGRGIFQYHYDTDSFTNISESDGLPNNVVYGILDDNHGNLWISCNKGLARFNPESHNKKVFTKEDGLQSNEFNYKSYLKSSEGKLYFGGINGFNCFFPSDLRENSVIPNVEITSVDILNKSDREFNQKLRTAVNSKSIINLPYRNSSFSISYIGLSFYSPENNQYAYQLVGIDEGWKYVDNKNSVTYINLPPGEYTFKVKASNNDTLWNEGGDEIRLKILPPIWLTIWAKLFYFLLFGFLVFSTFRFYYRRSKRRQEQALDAFKLEQETLAFKSKIDFFATIAHEIRTPLNLITAPLEEIILSKEWNEYTQQNLILIQRNSKRLSELIGQLLNFRKMDPDRFIVNPEYIDLKKLLIDICERFYKTMQNRKIDFIQDFEDGNFKLISDTDALIKIVENLLTNALKFTKDKIILKLRMSEEETFEISVKDNGKGIPDWEKNRIFDPFYQFQPDNRHQGMGIGLSLVKHLSEVLSGSVTIEDAENGGAVFIFHFKSIRKELMQESEIQSEQKANSNNKLNILIVDDEKDFLLFLRSFLHNEYSVDVVGNASEALAAINTKDYDLIVTDIMMPDTDGISLALKIKRDDNYCHIPIILLSAKIDQETKIEGLKSGAEAFVEKPFSPAFLKAQIESLLMNRKAILDTFNNNPLSSYSILATNKSDENFINKLNSEIEANLSDLEFSIESLSEKLFMSRSNLQRKIKSICGSTPNEYLRNYRLKKACKLLLETDMLIYEVALQTGFNSASYFTKCFMKQYNISPKDFLRKYIPPLGTYSKEEGKSS